MKGITLAQEANARKLDANHKHLEGVLSAINTKLDIIITKMDALPVQMKENLLTTLSVELQTLMISFREAFQDYLAGQLTRGAGVMGGDDVGTHTGYESQGGAPARRRRVSRAFPS